MASRLTRGRSDSEGTRSETIDDAVKNGKSRRGVSVVADFVRAPDDESDGSVWERWKQKASKFLSSMYLANFIVIVVFIDAYSTCRDIDARAKGQTTPEAFLVLSDLCLVLYTVELLLHISLQGLGILRDWMICMDLGIIVCGYLEMLLDAFMDSESVVRVGVVRALRLVRIFRLIRLLRKIRTLRELHKLATMMATCAKTLVWSFLLCFLVMTVWSMLMVEMVHPLLLDLRLRGTFSDCKGCDRAMASVMEANLLLFKTVIAGDSWGEIAVPVIEQYPATAVIFMGSLLTLVFGVLNLIVAVVVDTFADARLNDVQNLAEEMEDEIQKDRKSLAKLFQRIDLDGSGQLTLEELIEGAQRDADFQSRLRVMDIDESDLQMLFEMIDADQSGTIEAAEFIGPLSRWAHDSKTAPRFIKYNMLQTMQLQEDLYDMCADCFRHLALQIDKVSVEVKGISRKMAKGTKSEKPVTPKGSHSPDRAERDRRSNMRVSAMSATSGMEHGEVGQSELKPPIFEAEATEAEAKSAETIRVSKAEQISVSDVFPLEQAEQAENHDFEDDAVSPQASEHTEHSRIFDMDLHSEMEHVMAMRPSLQPTMLTEKVVRDSKTIDTHLDLLLESAVVKLETCVKKMERFARSADVMVRKWNEVPDHQRRGRVTSAGLSTSTSSRKSDVFWAMYMDREFVRDRKAKKRHTGPAANLPMAARGSKKKPTDEEIDLSMIGVSGASSILEQSGESD